MEEYEKVWEYYSLSEKYLEGADLLFKEKNLEPALFSAIHALELSIKSALYTISDEDITVHRVGGMFGKYFRKKVGEETCKKINKILSRYNVPRYPMEEKITYEEVNDVLDTIKSVVREIIPSLMK